MEGIDINALQTLLCPPKDDTDSSDDDLPKSNTAKIGPGDIGSARKAPDVLRPIDAATDVTSGMDIWSESEIPTEVICDASQDPRIAPEYHFKFRQTVASEDLYLQMGNKTPSTASCEDIVVVVNLPGEKLQNIDVNVTEKYLDIRSKIYRLNLALPHTVEPNSGKAEWLAEESAMKVTMKMVREFDYVNF